MTKISLAAGALLVSLASVLAPAPSFAATARPTTSAAPAASDTPAASDAPEDDDAASDAPARPKLSLHPQRGHIELGKGLASLSVPAGFGYVEPREAEEILVKGWGNPPDTKTLGMILPDGIDVTSDEGWGVVITYTDDGHVSDEDAQKIDYAELLTSMQSQVKDENDERKKEGFEPISLIGWAKPPRYDRAARKLYWAKELAFGNGAEHTLNYNIRVLGKEGVLVLNAVAGMKQLPQVERDMGEVMTFVEFTDANRYDKFDPKTGKMAAYGLAGLVAGGALLKGGFFKVLLAGLFAAKKLIAVGLAGLGGLVAKVFKKKTSA